MTVRWLYGRRIPLDRRRNNPLRSEIRRGLAGTILPGRFFEPNPAQSVPPAEWLRRDFWILLKKSFTNGDECVKIPSVRGISAVGSAQHWQCWGQEFESPMLHKQKGHPTGWPFCLWASESRGRFSLTHYPCQPAILPGRVAAESDSPDGLTASRKEHSKGEDYGTAPVS